LSLSFFSSSSDIIALILPMLIIYNFLCVSMRYIFFRDAKRVMSSRVIVVVIISPCIPTLYFIHLSSY
jgi:hypothetical protein